MHLTPEHEQTLRIIFEGRVQGVGFRYATRQIALGFDIIGSVTNLADGSVELIIQGETEELEEFIIELTEESPLSHHIKTIRREEIEPLENTRGFSIKN